jgi:hypothetical protein
MFKLYGLLLCAYYLYGFVHLSRFRAWVHCVLCFNCISQYAISSWFVDKEGVIVGVCVGDDGLLWLLFLISYILVSSYWYIVYGVICFGKIVV